MSDNEQASESVQSSIEQAGSDQTSQAGTGDMDAAVKRIHQRAGPSRVLILLLMLLLGSLIGGVGIGFYYWSGIQTSMVHMHSAMDRARREQQALLEQFERTRQDLGEQERRIQRQEAALSEQKQEMAAQREELALRRKQLEQQEEAVRHTLSQVHEWIGQDSQAWRVSEAEHLLEVAHQRLNLDRDLDLALRAASSANEQLGATGDPRWFEVREALAQDIERLLAAQRIDKSALSQRLRKLAEQAERLPQRHSSKQPPGYGRPAPRSRVDRNLDSLLKDSWEGLKSLLIIRRSDQPWWPPMVQEQSFFVRQNLQLQLDAARFALLRDDNALYRSALETAQVWVKTFHDPKSGEIGQFLEELAALQGVDITPDLPSLEPTLRLLREARDTPGEPPV
jgi:uroporphyrin-3 C-methyltransferase